MSNSTTQHRMLEVEKHVRSTALAFRIQHIGVMKSSIFHSTNFLRATCMCSGEKSDRSEDALANITVPPLDIDYIYIFTLQRDVFD